MKVKGDHEKILMELYWIVWFSCGSDIVATKKPNERKLKIQTARQKKNAWAGHKIIICNKFKNINSWFLEYFTNFITTWQQDTILQFRCRVETGALHNWPGKPGCDYTNKIRILKKAPMDKNRNVVCDRLKTKIYANSKIVQKKFYANSEMS